MVAINPSVPMTIREQFCRVPNRQSLGVRILPSASIDTRLREFIGLPPVQIRNPEGKCLRFGPVVHIARQALNFDEFSLAVVRHAHTFRRGTFSEQLTAYSFQFFVDNKRVKAEDFYRILHNAQSADEALNTLQQHADGLEA